MDVSNAQTDGHIWAFAVGCNSKVLVSVLTIAKVPTANCVDGLLHLRLFHAVKMGLISLKVDSISSTDETCRDKQKITVQFLAGLDGEKEARLGRQCSSSKVRQKKLKLGENITLLHPLQMDNWTSDLMQLLPNLPPEQWLEAVSRYLNKCKLHGPQEEKMFGAGKRMAGNRGSVHSVEYHPIADDDICVGYVRGMVYPGHKNSQARLHPHLVWYRIHKQSGAIQEADCQCSAGLSSGVCPHIVALLYFCVKLRKRSSKGKASNKTAKPTFNYSECTGIQGEESDAARKAVPQSQPKTLSDYDLDGLAEITNGKAGILTYCHRFCTSNPALSIEPDLTDIETYIQIASDISTDTAITSPESSMLEDVVPDTSDTPYIDAIGHHLLHHQEVPVVFTNVIHHWPAAKWTPNTLQSLLKDQLLTFRIGRRNSSEVQWETECDYESATMSDFINWMEGLATDFQNPLSLYERSTNWCYCDYKHFPHQFPDRPDILKAVDWSKFGFPMRGGEKSTFWMGSTGANTQCHYDTYGCNLVAQIYGRKRWVMFPPSQTEHLYPTRIPYEESSIYSNVNIINPDLCRYPKFKETSPFVVILEPGDVLFVPRHWWHHVTSLTTSVSINTWIELPSDDEERLHEAVTRAIVTTFMRNSDTSWLNPNEELPNFEESISCVQNMLDIPERNHQLDSVLEEPCKKRLHLGASMTHPGHCLCEPSYPYTQLSETLNTKSISPLQFDDYYQTIVNESTLTANVTHVHTSTELDVALVNSFSQPHIIRNVCKILKENF